ncbi:MAG TPA: DUF2442 domain-containing protein [Candidatus Eisenbacteria bacterium]|nr:DUF2442 domain-containing protein [Candidatus Eisenbacteria bacterium]
MKSAPRGNDTSQAEVSGISAHGVWLFLGDREVFLPFKDFPWFREAPVAGVLNVERPQPNHLYWPDLDIDLDVESILEPKRFPLVAREKPSPRVKPGAGLRRAKTSAPRRPRGRGRVSR